MQTTSYADMEEYIKNSSESFSSGTNLQWGNEVDVGFGNNYPANVYCNGAATKILSAWSSISTSMGDVFNPWMYIVMFIK